MRERVRLWTTSDKCVPAIVALRVALEGSPTLSLAWCCVVASVRAHSGAGGHTFAARERGASLTLRASATFAPRRWSALESWTVSLSRGGGSDSPDNTGCQLKQK